MTNRAKGKSDVVELDLDAVVIGGGFAGVYLLYKLRKEGFNVKLIEAGSGLGGIWHWNNCPLKESKSCTLTINADYVFRSWRSGRLSIPCLCSCDTRGLRNLEMVELFYQNSKIDF